MCIEGVLQAESERDALHSVIGNINYDLEEREEETFNLSQRDKATSSFLIKCHKGEHNSLT